MSYKRPFNKNKKSGSGLTLEKKIENFIIRNSQNGYFTKISTIPYKFEVSESRTWDIVGEFLTSGNIESTHDQITGEMKLCEFGKTYEILDLEKRRKKQKRKTSDKKKIKNNKNNKEKN